jgi:2-C-methyl-D-erythritol 4-phosphate cytidylyltransferase
MKKYAIIVAGGKGERMKTDLPKQFLSIKGKPLLMHTLNIFYQYDKSIETVLVLPANQIDIWQVLCQKHHFHLPHRIVAGGETRFHSVLNGLATIPSEGLVAIHDGVRPFVSTDTISRCFSVAEEKGSAIPCVSIAESIRHFDNSGNKAVDRNQYCLIQTPQVFQIERLKKAYEQTYNSSFTDDASILESTGEKIHLVDGNRENIKITTPFDLEIAESILSKRML